MSATRVYHTYPVVIHNDRETFLLGSSHAVPFPLAPSTDTMGSGSASSFCSDSPTYYSMATTAGASDGASDGGSMHSKSSKSSSGSGHSHKHKSSKSKTAYPVVIHQDPKRNFDPQEPTPKYGKSHHHKSKH